MTNHNLEPEDFVWKGEDGSLGRSPRLAAAARNAPLVHLDAPSAGVEVDLIVIPSH